MKKVLWRETFKLWTIFFNRIPLIFWLRPKILELSEKRAVISISLKRRTRNHLNSMYFGVLCTGADIAGAVYVLHFAKSELTRLAFVFKDMHADFLKRAEAEVVFTCEDGEAIRNTIAKTMQSKERENTVIHVIATTPSVTGDLPIAKFTLTASMKYKG